MVKNATCEVLERGTVTSRPDDTNLHGNEVSDTIKAGQNISSPPG
jgi:hypothetical protein